MAGECTPLEAAPAGLANGSALWLEREDLHETGSFKWRGALPALRAFRDRGAGTVVTASTGNHGAASAWAAQRTGMRAIVFAPEGSSPPKLALLEELGAELHLVGRDLDEAKDRARRFAAEGGLAGAPVECSESATFADGMAPESFAG